MSSEDNGSVDFLVVDDEKLIHDLVRRILRASGLKSFLFAYGANEALRIMRARNVKLLITDWVMPGMTGIELVRVVREDPRLFNTPILVLTGVCTTDSVVCAIEEGADGYVVKPFTAVKLMKTISSVIQRRSAPIQSKIAEMTRLKLGGRHEEAIAIGREILKESRDPNVLFMIGESLAKKDQLQDAIEALRESARMEKCGKSENLLGKIFMKQGDREKGLDHLKRASEQCLLVQKRKVDLAEAYFQSGQAENAEAAVESILKSSPTNLILADLGKLYLEQGDIDQAGAFLKEGVTPTPETVPIFNNYAIALRRRGLYEESESVYKKCIELVPDSFALYFNAGMLSKHMKHYEQAKKMFENALRLNPSYEPAKIFLDAIESKIAS